MDARSVFVALYLLFPIHCVALDADTVFDILNDKINTEMRTMTVKFAAEKERRIRFENMVRTSLRDLHLALNVSHDEGDSTTVKFDSIETKLEELQVQMSEERRTRMEEVRMLEQKLEEQDILLEQEKEIIKDLTSKLEGYDQLGREKDEELKELKAQLNATQNELINAKAFKDITHDKNLASLFVAFQKEKMLRSSLSSTVSSLEVRTDNLILTDTQFENRLSEVESGFETFGEFKDNISTVAENRFVTFDEQVGYLVINLTEIVQKTVSELDDCKQGYTEINQFHRCYKLSTTKMTFSESRAQCQRDGNDLIMFESKEELEYFRRVLSAMGPWKAVFPAGGIHVGYEGPPNNYKWLNGTALLAKGHSEGGLFTSTSTSTSTTVTCGCIRTSKMYWLGYCNCRFKGRFICGYRR